MGWGAPGCTFGCQGLFQTGRSHGGPGLWGAPLGAKVSLARVGIGFLWVPRLPRVGGCGVHPWPPGSGRISDPLGAGIPTGPFALWGTLGCRHPTPPPPSHPQQSERAPGETREQHIGRVLGQVAPSMMLCSLSEVICFCLGERGALGAVGGTVGVPMGVPMGALMGAPMGVTMGGLRGAPMGAQWVSQWVPLWVSRWVPQWVLNGCHDGCPNGCPDGCPLGVTMGVTEGCPNGCPMGVLVSRWVLNGCPMGVQWVFRGVPHWVLSRCPNGGPVGAQWVSQWVPQWLSSGCHDGCPYGCPGGCPLGVRMGVTEECPYGCSKGVQWVPLWGS